MKKAVRLASLIIGIAAVALASSAEAAPVAKPVLGSEGEVYRLVAAHDEAGDPFLVLHIEHPNGTAERIPVPATQGRGVESSPYLIYENASRTLFFTWEERLNYIHSLIHLVGFRDGEWTESIEVSEGSFGFKGAPRLAATQDAYVVGLAEGGTQVISRTVLHVVWVEERSEGQFVAYAPVTLLDGAYLGQRRIFNLSSMVAASEPLATDLWQSPAPIAAPAADDHSVNVAFIHPDSGRLASVRITMLPGELSRIADGLRNHLIDVGARYDWQSPTGLRRLADELRNHLIDVGVRLDPQILRHVADGLRNHLIDVGIQYSPSDLTRMAGDLRNHLIDVGFRLDDRGLRRISASTEPRPVIEVARIEDDDRSLATQVAQVTLAAKWTRPDEAVDGGTLMVSRSGQAALVSWTDGNAVFYRETFGDDWSPVVRLPLGESLGSEQAISLLQDRIRHR